MSRIRIEIRNVNLFLAAAMSLIFIIVDFAVWCAIGSPLFVLHFISDRVPVPPLWIFGLCDFLCFALLGLALGALLGNAFPARDVPKYRGAFYFTVGIVFNVVHHFLFFGGGRFLVALPLCLLSCFFLVIAVVDFFKVSSIASISALLGISWVLYLALLNLLTFFRT